MLARTIAPELFSDVMSLAHRVLPDAVGPEGDVASPGRSAASNWASSSILKPLYAAAQENGRAEDDQQAGERGGVPATHRGTTRRTAPDVAQERKPFDSTEAGRLALSGRARARVEQGAGEFGKEPDDSSGTAPE